jgi:hypothetical protein
MTNKTKQASAYLQFCAMSELMLSQYENASALKVFDPALFTKLKNLKANFERVTLKAHMLFSEDEQKVFFDLINVFEMLLNHASDQNEFTELIGLIKAWENGDVKIID